MLKKSYREYRSLFALASIVLITFLCYGPALNNGYTNWDDEKFLINNPLVQSLEFSNITKIFTDTSHKSYVPLTVFSFAVENHFFGLNPFVYHLNNIILHIAVSILVFYFLREIGFNLRSSWLAALIFAVHPMHVESVAWITERKDVLFALFYMAALLCYAKYLNTGRRGLFISTIPLGILSMLAKPMALSLPFVFFVCDYFKGEELNRKRIVEKAYHFAYIIPLALITYFIHDHKPFSTFAEGLLVWIWTFVFYIRKFFVPLDLMPYYTLPYPITLMNMPYLFSIFIFSAVIFILFRFKSIKSVQFALLFYSASIFFLLKFDDYFVNIVADRYMYLPSLGFCLLLGFWADLFLSRMQKLQKLTAVFRYMAVFMALGVLGIMTMNQNRIWKDSLTLWSTVIEKNPNIARAYYNRAKAFESLEQYSDAVSDYSRSIALDNQLLFAHFNRAAIYKKMDRTEEALTDYNQLIEIEPAYHKAYNNRGNIYKEKGEYSLALKDYQKAIELSPKFITAYQNRGVIYRILGEDEKALEDFNFVLNKNADFIEARFNRGSVYITQGRNKEALNDYNSIIRLNPQYKEAYYNRSIIFKRLHMYDSALKDALMAKSLGYSEIDEYINNIKTNLDN